MGGYGTLGECHRSISSCHVSFHTVSSSLSVSLCLSLSLPLPSSPSVNMLVLTTIGCTMWCGVYCVKPDREDLSAQKGLPWPRESVACAELNSNLFIYGGVGYHPSVGHMVRPHLSLHYENWLPFSLYTYQLSRADNVELSHGCCCCCFCCCYWVLVLCDRYSLTCGCTTLIR